MGAKTGEGRSAQPPTAEGGLHPPEQRPVDPETGERLTGRIETEGVQGGQIRRGKEWRRRFAWAREHPSPSSNEEAGRPLAREPDKG